VGFGFIKCLPGDGNADVEGERVAALSEKFPGKE
jgi:hypothetical protein